MYSIIFETNAFFIYLRNQIYIFFLRRMIIKETLRNHAGSPCGNINKFSLLREIRKFWHVFYNGGL